MLNVRQEHIERAKALEKARNEDAGQQESSSGFKSGFGTGRNRTNETINYSKENLQKKKRTLNLFFVLKQASMLKDMPFVCAILASFLKEIIDVVFAPTIVLPITFSMLNAIFGFMMMQLAKFSEKAKVHSRFMIRVGILIAGSMLDSIPGLGFLPISIATIFIGYMLTLWERANAEK
jgi:hypothetical protein